MCNFAVGRCPRVSQEFAMEKTMIMKRVFTRMLAVAGMMAAFGSAVNAEKTELSVPDGMEGWTVINANNDDFQWAYNADKSGAVLPQNTKMAANDWIISPVVNLSGGVTYRIKSWIQNLTTFSSDKQQYEITVGHAPTAEAQTTQLFKEESFTKTSWPVERPEGDKAGVFTPEADGDYYIGFHCYSKSYQGDFLFQKFTIEEVLALPGAVTELTATAADGGELSVNLSWVWPSVNSNGSERTAAVTGAKLYRGNGSLVSATSTYLVGDMAGGDAGASATLSDVVPQAGKYCYMVVPFDENGVSDATPLKAQTLWVGEDTSIPTLGSVTATVVDDTTVEVDFDAPVTGGNGGYLDPSKLSYRIVRKSGSGVNETLEEAYTGTLPYEDATIPGLDSYSYTVYVQYDGKGSSFSGKESNKVKCGGALVLPYTQDFAKIDNLELFTIFHGPECTRDWGVSSGHASFWGGGVADAWMITPAFSLEAGKNYEIRFDAWLSRAISEANYKTLAVTIGADPTAEGQTTVLFDQELQSGLKDTEVINFTVSADGTYHIGFHCHGKTDSNDLYVDDLSVKETMFVPSSVDGLEVEAGEKGALTAVIRFNAPVLTTAGTQLETLSRIEVKCGTESVGIKEDVAAGEAVELVDATVTEAGLRTYSVVAYLGESASEQVLSTPVWVGVDRLKSVANVVAEKSGESEVTVSFDAVAEGMNGGYVDAENVRYIVTRMPDGEVIADDAAVSPVVDSTIAGLALARYTYEVAAFVDDDQSDAVASNPLTLGDALELPYAPNMMDASTFDLWTFVADEGTGSWKHSSGKGLQTSLVSNAPYAYTPPFKAQQGEYKLVCNIKSYSGLRKEMVDVILSTDPVHVADTPETPEEPAAVAQRGATPAVHTVLQTIKAESSYSADTEVLIKITVPGVYHIGFRNVSNKHTDEDGMSWGNYTCTLDKVELSAVKLISGLDATGTCGADIWYDVSAEMVVVAGDAVSSGIYNLDGSLVGAADASSLESGFYIAVAVMADGSRQTLRFVKK